jgi:hypothetical protein
MTRSGSEGTPWPTILSSLNAEIEECVARLRPHLPEATDVELYQRALSMRARRYETGRWPTETELAELVEKWRLDAQWEAAAPRKGIVMQFPKKTDERLL